MSTETCSASSCSKPGKLLCTGCTTQQSRYCSKECQKRDWKTHKLSCAAAQKSNCFLIRALASTPGTAAPIFADHIEPFNLEAYGSERGEMAELEKRLGWARANEVGKFYDAAGADTWYYYAYGPFLSEESPLLPKNELASLCIGRTVLGDIAVIRSGPASSNNYAEHFSKAELVRTTDFYKTAQPSTVFAQREMARACTSYGISKPTLGSLHISL